MNDLNENMTAANAAKNRAINPVWLILSGAVSIANSVLVWIFMARYRDAEELGRFTIVMGLYALFYNICSFNLGALLVREISRRSGKKDESLAEFIGTSTAFLLASGTLCAVLMALGGLFFGNSHETEGAAAILSLALIPTALITLGEAKALADGRGRLIAAVTTAENFLRTVIPLFLIVGGFSLKAICLSFVAVRIFAAAIYTGTAQIEKFVFVRGEFAALAKAAPTLTGTIVLASLTAQMPIFLLAHFSSEAESARYGAASRFLIPATILAVGFANAMHPALVCEWEKSAAAGIDFLRRRALPIFFLTGAAAILSPFLSETVLVFLFGEKFADSARVLDLLAISVVPFALLLLTARGLIAADAMRVDLSANALGAAACLISGLFLVPASGAFGAAATQLIAFSVMAIFEIAVLLNLPARLKNQNRRAFSPF